MLFKMGKFYEMFEMDAHVGVEVLGLMYMKVSTSSKTVYSSSPLHTSSPDGMFPCIRDGFGAGCTLRSSQVPMCFLQ